MAKVNLRVVVVDGESNEALATGNVELSGETSTLVRSAGMAAEDVAWEAARIQIARAKADHGDD